MRLERFIYRKFVLLVSVCLAIVVVNLVLYFTAIARLDKFSRDTKARILDNRTKLRSAEKRNKAISASVENVRVDRQVVSDLADKIMMTRAQRMVQVQKELAFLIQKNQLAMEKISYSYSILPSNLKTSWGHKYIRLDMTVPLSGTYPQLKALLKDLQESPQFFLVGTVGLSSGNQGGLQLRLNLNVSTYFVATDSDLSDAEGGKA